MTLDELNAKLDALIAQGWRFAFRGALGGEVWGHAEHPQHGRREVSIDAAPDHNVPGRFRQALIDATAPETTSVSRHAK